MPTLATRPAAAQAPCLSPFPATHSATHPTPRACPQPATTTLYLGAAEAVALARQLGLRACFEGVAQRIEAAFCRWPDFDKTARLAAHGPLGAVELMPVADARLHGFKLVNGHPGNTAHGLPTVMASGVLSDMATGRPLLLTDLTLWTAIRTAAMSALAARWLARPGSRVMALIGNGAQAEFQALAFHALLGVDRLQLVDTDPAATAKLQRNLAGRGLQLRVCTSAEAAVQGADIVTTITADKKRAAVLRPEWLQPGQHVNGVGGDAPGKTELHPGVLTRATRVFVEYEPQTRVEGDIQQLPADFPVTELWRVFTAQAPGRTQASDLTVFDSVGFALEDWATLGFMHEAALRLGLGTPLQLVAHNADPKDLFGLLGDGV